MLEIIRQTQQTAKDAEEILLEILSSEVLVDLVESHLVIGTPGLLDFITILTAIELSEESVQKTLIRD